VGQKSGYWSFWLAGFVIWLASCQPSPAEFPAVVVYTSVDQPFAEPVLVAFQESTGIKVEAVYDVEAAKTTGLVNRLIAEGDQPKADVFWNSEVIQTVRLRERGLLQAYPSPLAEGIPAAFRDMGGFWTGVAARARVLIVNTQLVEDAGSIDSIYKLLDSQFPGQVIGIANPLFGTSATHAAALYQALGAEEGRAFYQALAGQGVQMVDGNAVVRDLVASGSLAFGLTDTDDACGALQRGAPVAVVLPDQDGLGTLVIPSAVALLAGAPHPSQGQALVDFLLRPETEKMLLEAGFSHFPLHIDLQAYEECIPADSVHVMAVDYQQVYQFFEVTQSELRAIFLR